MTAIEVRGFRWHGVDEGGCSRGGFDTAAQGAGDLALYLFTLGFRWAVIEDPQTAEQVGAVQAKDDDGPRSYWGRPA